MTPAQTTATQVLTLNNIGVWNKKELTELAQTSVAEMAECGDDVLGLLALAAKLEHFAGEIKRVAKDRGIDDLAKWGKSGVSKSGVVLVPKEVGVTYDYSRDPIWVRQTGQIAQLDEQLARRETLLKSLPVEGQLQVDEETSEIFRAYPPLRTGRESIQATIL